ncbi:MAG TPA: reverse transcriptase family protein, partial [Hyphomicrobium sp.]|nr:reverse transcriptase family protein [Hyphomicrobium sp.]
MEPKVNAVLADASTALAIESVVRCNVRLCAEMPWTAVDLLVLPRGPEHLIMGAPITRSVYAVPAGDLPVFRYHMPGEKREPDGLEDPREPVLLGEVSDAASSLLDRLNGLDCARMNDDEALSLGREAATAGLIPTVCETAAGITRERLATLFRLLLESREAFGPVDNVPAKLPPAKFYLKPDAVPRRFQPRRFSKDDEEFVTDQLRKWEQLGIIVPCSGSPWASRLVVARRADGSRRLCVSYVYANSQCLDEPNALPRIQDVILGCAGGAFLSSYDLSSGYLQMLVDEESRDVLAFATSRGVFTFTRVPFGIKPAPALFHRAIADAIADIGSAHNYLDDVGLISKHWDEFVADTRRWLEQAIHLHLRIGAKKSKLLHERLSFLGRLITSSGYTVDPARLQGIRDLALPHDRRSLLSVLGLLKYFAPFVPDFHRLAAGLMDLTKAGRRFVWSDQLTADVEAIRARLLANPLFLSFPDPALVFYLATDASELGCGVLLLQASPGVSVDFGDPERPAQPLNVLAVLSHKWSDVQSRWTTTEREAFAVVWGLQKCASLIVGQMPVNILCDHANLLHWETSANAKLM